MYIWAEKEVCTGSKALMEGSDSVLGWPHPQGQLQGQESCIRKACRQVEMRTSEQPAVFRPKGNAVASLRLSPTYGTNLFSHVHWCRPAPPARPAQSWEHTPTLAHTDPSFRKHFPFHSTSPLSSSSFMNSSKSQKAWTQREKGWENGLYLS